MNPDLDLGIERVIRAPRKTVWDAWTNPDSLARWWVPAPATAGSNAWKSGRAARS